MDNIFKFGDRNSIDLYFIQNDPLLEASDEQRFMTDIQKTANKRKRANVQRIGIEAEVSVNRNHVETENFLKDKGILDWTAVRDGSVSGSSRGAFGVELKTRGTISLAAVPAKIDELKNDIMDSELKGDTNSTCGVHVHFGLSPNVNYTVLDLYRLLLLCKDKESEIESAAGRPIGRWARDLQPLIDSFNSEINKLKTKEKVAVNLRHTRFDQGYREPFSYAEWIVEFSRSSEGLNKDAYYSNDLLKEILTSINKYKVVVPEAEENNFDSMIALVDDLYDEVDILIENLEVTGEDFDGLEELNKYMKLVEMWKSEFSDADDAISQIKGVTAAKQLLSSGNLPTTAGSRNLMRLVSKLRTNLAFTQTQADTSAVSDTQVRINEFVQANQSDPDKETAVVLANKFFRDLEDMDIYGEVYQILKEYQAELANKVAYKARSMNVGTVGEDWFTDENAAYYDQRRYFGINVTNIGSIRKQKYDTFSGGFKHGEFSKYNTVEFRYGDGALSEDPEKFKEYIKLCHSLIEQAMTGDTVMEYNGVFLKDVSRTMPDAFLNKIPDYTPLGTDAGHVLAVYEPSEDGNIDSGSLIGYLFVANLFKALHRPRSESKTGDKLRKERERKVENVKNRNSALLRSQGLSEKDVKIKGAAKFGEQMDESQIEIQVKKQILATVRDKAKFKEDVKKLLKYAKQKDSADINQELARLEGLLSRARADHKKEEYRNAIKDLKGGRGGPNEIALMAEIRKGSRGDVFDRLGDEYRKNFESAKIKEEWGSEYAFPSEVYDMFARRSDWPDSVKSLKVLNYNDNLNTMTLEDGIIRKFRHGTGQDEDGLSWSFSTDRTDGFTPLDRPVVGMRARIINSLTGADRDWSYILNYDYGKVRILNYGGDSEEIGTAPDDDGNYIELDNEYNSKAFIVPEEGSWRAPRLSPKWLLNNTVKVYDRYTGNAAGAGIIDKVEGDYIGLKDSNSTFDYVDDVMVIPDEVYFNKYKNINAWDGKYVINTAWSNDSSKSWTEVKEIAGDKIVTDYGTFDVGTGTEPDGNGNRWLIVDDAPIDENAIADMDIIDITGHRLAWKNNTDYLVAIKAVSSTRFLTSNGGPVSFAEGVSVSPEDMKWRIDINYKNKYTKIENYTAGMFLYRVERDAVVAGRSYKVIEANPENGTLLVEEMDTRELNSLGQKTVPFGNGVLPDDNGNFWVVKVANTAYGEFA